MLILTNMQTHFELQNHCDGCKARTVIVVALLHEDQGLPNRVYAFWLVWLQSGKLG